MITCLNHWEGLNVEWSLPAELRCLYFRMCWKFSSTWNSNERTQNVNPKIYHEDFELLLFHEHYIPPKKGVKFTLNFSPFCYCFLWQFFRCSRVAKYEEEENRGYRLRGKQKNTWQCKWWLNRKKICFKDQMLTMGSWKSLNVWI